MGPSSAEETLEQVLQLQWLIVGGKKDEFIFEAHL